MKENEVEDIQLNIHEIKLSREAREMMKIEFII
jgi:hypothetical protein